LLHCSQSCLPGRGSFLKNPQSALKNCIMIGVTLRSTSITRAMFIGPILEPVLPSGKLSQKMYSYHQDRAPWTLTKHTVRCVIKKITSPLSPAGPRVHTLSCTPAGTAPGSAPSLLPDRTGGGNIFCIVIELECIGDKERFARPEDPFH
jgi:hypothetical protein